MSSVGRAASPPRRVALLGAAILLALSSSGFADTAAEAAKKPTQSPKPYRLSDGHLNLTGFWVPVGGMLERDIGLGGTPAGGLGGGGPPGNASSGPAGAQGGGGAVTPGVTPPGGATPGGATVGDIPVTGGSPPGSRAASGGAYTPFSGYPALKSPYKERLVAAQKDAAAGKVSDPASRCLPQGMPRMMGMIYGMEFLQTPGQVAMTSEYAAASRRVWLDQKQHTPDDELDPTFTGESIGHWEGDTLVVDTVGIRSDIPLNNRNLPHSAKLHLVERFSEPSPGMLAYHAVVDDPDVFESVWTEDLKFRYRPDLRIREYVCLENNRNVGTGGEAVFDK